MKICLYARVSSEKQEKQETIKSQIDSLRKYAKQKNYTIVDEYIDDGYSGELLSRPSLDRLRDDVKKGIFEGVLIYSADRLSRDFINLGIVKRELKKQGVEVLAQNRPEGEETPQSILLGNIEGVIAEYEKAMILERTRRGRLHKAQNGQLVTSQAPYGYKYVKGNRNNNTVGYYEIIPKEAKVVQLIFDLVVNKQLSIRAVARELTKREIPPKRGIHWRTSSLHRIIRNETYIGLAYYNKHIAVEPTKKNDNKYRRNKNSSIKLRPKEEWIPIKLPKELRIIDKKLFDRAQKQLIKNSNESPRNVKYQYLLRGLIKCGKCDSPYNGTRYRHALYYRCGNRHRTFPLPRNCKMNSIKAEEIEEIVWNKFCEAIKNPKLITEQVSKLKEKEKTRVNRIPEKINEIEKGLENIENEESRLLDAYRQSALSIDQLKGQMKKIDENKKRLHEEKDELSRKQESLISKSTTQKSIVDYCKHVEQRLDKLRDDFESKRHLLNLALNCVVFEGRKVRIKGVIPVPPDDNHLQTANIASPITGYYERNTSIEYELEALIA